MKCFRYCSVLLLCFALFLGVFSVGVSAKSVSVPPFYIVSWGNYVFDGVSGNNSEQFTFTPRNGVRESKNIVKSGLVSNRNTTITSNISYSFIPIDNDIFFPPDGKVTVTIKYLRMQTVINDSSNSVYLDPSDYRLLVKYSDGTMQYVDNDGDGTVFTFTPKKNVVEFEVIGTVTYSIGVGSYSVIWVVGEGLSSDNGNEITVNVTTEEVGLLKDIKNGINNLFNSITELPAKIWQFISDGLKSLFVPSEEFITDYKDRMDTMLAEKLGAVYECSNVLFESWDRITDSDDTNTIEFPATTIDVGETDFTFGGYQVEIVPHGFDFLASAVKLIVAILCTIAFVNGMRKRYDEVMGG